MTQQNQSAADTLRKARALLAEGKWCKGGYAVDKDGEFCDESTDAAVAWCALGAVIKVEPDIIRQAFAEKYLQMAAPPVAPGAGPVPEFNDAPETTLADVLALYDRAIALAEHDAQSNQGVAK